MLFLASGTEHTPNNAGFELPFSGLWARDLLQALAGSISSTDTLCSQSLLGSKLKVKEEAKLPEAHGTETEAGILTLHVSAEQGIQTQTCLLILSNYR